MMILADLELDLDVFQGPFDLLLALVLREEVELADVPIAEIVVAYVERAYEKGELDLESASEFLVLMAALLEIKVRLLFPGEVEEDDLSPEQAEAELFQRLIEYRRFQGAAAWLRDRMAGPPRVFRMGPRPWRRGRSRWWSSSARTPGSWRRPSTGCWCRPRISTCRPCGGRWCRWSASSTTSARSCARAAASSSRRR